MRLNQMALPIVFGGLAAVLCVRSLAAREAPASLSPIEQLGKAIFFDARLSANGTQSCSSCHDPAAGYTGPDRTINGHGAVMAGAHGERFGNRKPPTIAYAGRSPVLHVDVGGEWIGGMFGDGRATGSRLGDPLAEQAQGPFLNPLEQAMPHPRDVCTALCNAPYARLFEQVFGIRTADAMKDVDRTFERIARSLAAYERSVEVDSYTSKFDRFWDNAQHAGKDVPRLTSPNERDRSWEDYRGLGLEDLELRGLAAFADPSGANCASCHSLRPPARGARPLFTDFSYHNLGLPRNPENPFYTMPRSVNPEGANWVDPGLGGYLESAGHPRGISSAQRGKFKVPTLRNVDRRPSQDFIKAFGHNGSFKTLDAIVFFYHWRAMQDRMGGRGMGGGGGMAGGGMGGRGMGRGMHGAMFPPPELDENRTPLQMFSMADEDSIVAFLKTLSDGYSRE